MKEVIASFRILDICIQCAKKTGTPSGVESINLISIFIFLWIFECINS